jgi:hypothetical protein
MRAAKPEKKKINNNEKERYFWELADLSIKKGKLL